MGTEKTRGFRAAAGAVGMGVTALVLTAGSAGATAPVVRVKPTSGLASVATLKVWGIYVGDSKDIAILECNADDPSTTGGGCNLAGIAVVRSSTSGTIRTTFDVVETFTSTDGPVNCAPGADQCTVVVMNEKNQKDLGTFPITFTS